MKTGRKILIGVALVIVAGVGIGLSMYFKPHKDFAHSAPEFVVTATQIVQEFAADEIAANKKFVADDKTVQVTGTVREVGTDQRGLATVVLSTDGDIGSVFCTMAEGDAESTRNLAAGATIKVKGQVTGMQELIEKQVVMIRCSVVR